MDALGKVRDLKGSERTGRGARYYGRCSLNTGNVSSFGAMQRSKNASLVKEKVILEMATQLDS